MELIDLNVFSLIVAFLLIGIAIFMYFLPAIIGFYRNKHNKLAIFALNTLVGWSVIGWIISLIWALSGDVKPENIYINYPPESTTK